jgi:hypothetical protein
VDGRVVSDRDLLVQPLIASTPLIFGNARGRKPGCPRFTSDALGGRDLLSQCEQVAGLRRHVEAAERLLRRLQRERYVPSIAADVLSVLLNR